MLGVLLRLVDFNCAIVFWTEVHISCQVLQLLVSVFSS